MTNKRDEGTKTKEPIVCQGVAFCSTICVLVLNLFMLQFAQQQIGLEIDLAAYHLIYLVLVVMFIV